MAQYINKANVVAEIQKRLNANGAFDECGDEAWAEDKGMREAYKSILSFLDTLKVKEVGEKTVSNDLEDYAKKESESFAEREYEIDYIDRNALAKGYYWGVKAGAQWQKQKNVIEVLEKEIDEVIHNYKVDNHRHTSICSADIEWIAKHFFELGLKAQKG